MRIDRLTVRNFKKFDEVTFNLHPEFTLLIGENGSGKTSLLDALAVSLGIWLVDVPDSSLLNSRRNILPTEIRLEPAKIGDRIQFRERKPVQVEAIGRLGDHAHVNWIREIRRGSTRTSNQGAKRALSIIRNIYHRDEGGESVICPVLVYYGAGRAWLPSSKRLAKETGPSGPSRRWGAFYDCFNERIRFEELRKWFHRETTAAGARGGVHRSGFEVVRMAVLGCVPNADGLWFDPDRDQIVFSIKGHAQPFDNLSAGQKMMLALVADIAIKAVTQNAFLLPSDSLKKKDTLPRLLRETPGVVLIDEIDVHLHPKWQRRVIEDLRRTFPKIQFIGTTHSPFLVQSLRSGEELIRLDNQVQPAEVHDKPINEIAEGVMGVPSTQVSERYDEMKRAAHDFLLTLEEAAKAPEEKLAVYEQRLAEDIAPYADNPAFQAFLELKRAAKLGK